MGLDLFLARKISDERYRIEAYGQFIEGWKHEAFERVYNNDFEWSIRYAEDDELLDWIFSLKDHGGLEFCTVSDIFEWYRPKDCALARKALDEAVFVKDGKRRSYILMDLFEKHLDYYIGFSN